MSDVIVINDEACGRLIADRARCDWGEKSTCIARVVDNQLRGGAVYNGYTVESIQVHVAGDGDRWLNRDLMWVCFHFPFEQLKVARMFAQVPEDNALSLRFCQHAGWSPCTRIEGVYPNGVACLLWKMEREDCRFLKWRPRTIQSLAPVPEEV